MRNLSIRSRLFCLALLLFCMLIGFTVFLTHKLSSNTLEIEEEAEVASLLKKAHGTTKDFAELKYWLTNAAGRVLSQSNNQLFHVQQRLEADLRLIETSAPEPTQRVRRELKLLLDYVSKAIDAYTHQQNTLGDLLVAISGEQIKKVDDELESVVSQLEHNAVVRRDAAIRNLRETARLTILAAGLALLGFAILTAVIVSTITGPLRKLEMSIGAIISGKLNFNLPELAHDEIGKMARALSMLRDSLFERQRLEERRRYAEVATVTAQRQLKDAIETISDGFALYDSQDRLVICNQRYQEIFSNGQLEPSPGVAYEEVLRAAVGNVASNQVTEARLAARIQRRHRRIGNYETVNIGGRLISIRERPTVDGGIVGLYSDVTARQHDKTAKNDQVHQLHDVECAGVGRLSRQAASATTFLANENIGVIGPSFDSLSETVDAQFELGFAVARTSADKTHASSHNTDVRVSSEASGIDQNQALSSLAPLNVDCSLKPHIINIVHDAPALAPLQAPEPGEDAVSLRIAAIASDAFPNLDHNELQAITRVCSWFSIPGGSSLLRQGQESDLIYIVASGILGAYRADAAGQERLLGRIGVGELIGEMGFLTGDARTATIRALRNSELVKISRTDLPELASQHPGVLTEVCRTVISRLRDVQERGTAKLHAKTFCVIAEDANLDVMAFAEVMRGAAGGNPLVLTRVDAVGNTAEWFFRHERDHSAIIYVAEPQLTTWTKFCIRQSDHVVVLVRAQSSARPILASQSGQEIVPVDIPRDLVLMWDNTIVGSQASAWLEAVRPRFHYHVRSRADAERAARLITGNGVGLVLSGGGARGLAHVGVAKALRELGITIDAIGGTSIGALVGAGLALEWDIEPAFENCMQAFLRRPFLNDFGLSRSALFSGRKLNRLFNEWFGEICIEETPINFFCVTTNLTTGSLAVHTSGKVAEWVRASAAIPGVFPPFLNGGSVHVDGGVLDNLPISSMRRSGINSVIAVNVGLDDALSASAGPPGVLDLLKRVATIGSDFKQGSELQKCDILISPGTGHIRLLDWRSYEQAFAAGYRATMQQLSQAYSVSSSIGSVS